MIPTPTFDVDIKSDPTLGEELLVGFASPAIASLIGVDHMVTDSETELVGHMTVSGPAVGVLVTPADPPGPDFEVALRMLAVVEHHYHITVDITQLEEQSEEIQRYYEELAARIEAESVGRDLPEDRMYM